MFKIIVFLLLIVPVYCSSQTAKQIVGEGIVGNLQRYENFPSKIAEQRNVDVWLPRDYSENKKYAVLYMHDGQNLFNPKDAHGGVEWNVDETLQRLIDEGKVRDTIVVGIWNTAHRVIEYAPEKPFDLARRKGLKPAQFISFKEGASDKYLKFIVDELIPFIDKTYSVKPDRDSTFVMGSSMGGLMSLYAISEYPEIFGGAGCISTQFPLGNGVMLGYLEKYLPEPKNHKIYFDYGTKTLDAPSEPYQLKADKLMKAKGYRRNKTWVTRKFPGADHTEKSWRKRVGIPLVFLLGK